MSTTLQEASPSEGKLPMPVVDAIEGFVEPLPTLDVRKKGDLGPFLDEISDADPNQADRLVKGNCIKDLLHPLIDLQALPSWGRNPLLMGVGGKITIPEREGDHAPGPAPSTKASTHLLRELKEVDRKLGAVGCIGGKGHGVPNRFRIGRKRLRNHLSWVLPPAHGGKALP
jgi:hypothetical protein